MNRYFEDAQHAELYRKYRPKIPTTLVDRILKFLEQKRPSPHPLAVDVGCGSGQTTLHLAPHFDQVIGMDISEAQINEARKVADLPGNVSYAVSAAESLLVEDHSVDLLIATMCIHWFDLPAFYQEARRVLAPDGVLCAVGHAVPGAIVVANDPGKTEKLWKVTVGPSIERLAPYFKPGTYMVLKRYRDLDFPFDDCVREDCFSNHVDMSVADYVGVVTSYSAYQQLLSEKPQAAADALRSTRNGILQILGAGLVPPESVVVNVRHEFFFVMGRNKTT